MLVTIAESSEFSQTSAHQPVGPQQSVINIAVRVKVISGNCQ